MKANLFYSGLDFETKDVVDKRLYINGINESSIIDSFGENGKYAKKNVFVFNTEDDNFYKLTDETQPLNPESWKKLKNSFVSFEEYDSSAQYGKGRCVMMGSGDPNFYISNEEISSGEDPITYPDKWTKINSYSGSSSNFRKTEEYRINPSEGDFEIDIYINKTNLPQGTLPLMDFFIDEGNTTNGYKTWKRCFVTMESWTTTSQIRIKASFSGDLSNIYYNESDSSQNNIKIISI